MDVSKTPYKTNVPYRCVTKCPHFGEEGKYVGSTNCERCPYFKSKERGRNTVSVKCTYNN